MIAIKDVRVLAKNARIMNESEKSGREYALVWRAVLRAPMPAQAKQIKRRFLPNEKPEHISWWIEGALDAIETLGYHKEYDQLEIEQV